MTSDTRPSCFSRAYVEKAGCGLGTRLEYMYVYMLHNNYYVGWNFFSSLISCFCPQTLLTLMYTLYYNMHPPHSLISKLLPTFYRCTSEKRGSLVKLTNISCEWCSGWNRLKFGSARYITRVISFTRLPHFSRATLESWKEPAGVSLQSSRVAQHRSTFVQKPLK